MRGKEFVEYDNPYDVGMTGLLGFTSGYRAMEHCDALLMLGTDFPYRPFYPENARVVQVDIRGEHIGRRVTVDVAAGRHRQGHDPGAAAAPDRRARRRAPRADASRTTAARASGSTRWRAATATSGPIHPQLIASRDSTSSPPTTRCSSLDVGTPDAVGRALSDA